MTAELWQQSLRMGQAWLLVAVGVFLLGVFARRRLTPSAGWRRLHSHWGTLDVVLLLIFGLILPMIGVLLLKEMTWWKPDPTQVPNRVFESFGPLLGGAASQHAGLGLCETHTQFLWAKLFSGIAILAVAWLLLRTTYREWPRGNALNFWQSSWHLAWTWLAFTPLVILLNIACVTGLHLLDQTPERHPLTRVGLGETLWGKLLFFISVCGFTPLLEEFVFRGVVLPWATKSRRNPWVLLVAVGLLSFNAGTGPLVFAVLLLMGLYLLQKFGKLGRVRVRTVGAIWSSAALFAAIHVTVWPTPIPLFLLGLVLGYLALRTGSWWPCVVYHGLFNAISSVYLLL